MASGLDWNSEEEGTAGPDALKVEDLIELSEGNSGQSTQASPFLRSDWRTLRLSIAESLINVLLI